jgi:hypothetical protein
MRVGPDWPEHPLETPRVDRLPDELRKRLLAMDSRERLARQISIGFHDEPLRDAFRKLGLIAFFEFEFSAAGAVSADSCTVDGWLQSLSVTDVLGKLCLMAELKWSLKGPEPPSEYTRDTRFVIVISK